MLSDWGCVPPRLRHLSTSGWRWLAGLHVFLGRMAYKKSRHCTLMRGAHDHTRHWRWNVCRLLADPPNPVDPTSNKWQMKFPIMKHCSMNLIKAVFDRSNISYNETFIWDRLYTQVRHSLSIVYNRHCAPTTPPSPV